MSILYNVAILIDVQTCRTRGQVPCDSLTHVRGIKAFYIWRNSKTSPCFSVIYWAQQRRTVRAFFISWMTAVRDIPPLTDIHIQPLT